MTTDQIAIRRGGERGYADHGWLKSFHSFSFGDYHDPNHMGFRSLRVINQDRVTPGMGFPTHPHRNMEIFSYVLEGSLQHKDSMGNGRVLTPGQIQLMSAGSGITHSEYNPSDHEGLHFLQIWIRPSENNLEPSYTEWHPDENSADDGKVLVISPDGSEGSARINQDARVYRIRLEAGQETSHTLPPGRGLWLQVVRGSVQLNGQHMDQGDGASSEVPGHFSIRPVGGDDNGPAEALLFELG